MAQEAKQIILLGDSITEYFDHTAFLPEYTNIIDLGRAGDTVSQAIHRVSQLQNFAIDKLFILLGINDLAEGDPPSTILKHYQMLLEAIAQLTQAPLYVQSVLPANRLSYTDAGSPQTINLQVEEINRGLHKLAAVGGHTFVNLYPHFSQNNLLNPALTSDGLHLNELGYKLLAELLKSFLI